MNKNRRGLINQPDSNQVKEELSRGWRQVKLGDICQINPRRPKQFIRQDSQPTTFIPMDAVSATAGTADKPQTRPYGEIKKGYTFFSDGDVLFAKITPCMQNGKHFVVRNALDGVGFASTEFHVLRPRDSLLAEWVHFYLRQPAILKEAIYHFTGTAGQQRVPDSFLKELSFPLPPLAEQKRIVAVLNEQMAAVEKARAAALERVEAVRALTSAWLQEVFSFGNRDLPQGWRWTLLGKIARIFSGSSAPQGKDFFSESGVPFVRVSDLSSCNTTGILEKTRDRLSEEAISSCSLVKAPKGAVVFPKSGAAIATNRRAMLGMDAYIVGHLFALVAKPKVVMMEWLYSAMRQIDMVEHSDNAGYPSLKKSVVEKIKIPLPPLTEQKRLVSALSVKMAAAGKACAAAEAELEVISAMPSALLQEAFNGTL